MKAVLTAAEVQPKPHLAEATNVIVVANQRKIKWSRIDFITAMFGGFGEINFGKLRKIRCHGLFCSLAL